MGADEPRPGTGGSVTLWANDRKIGEGRLGKTVSVRFSGYSGMDIGRDNGLPVDREAYGDRSPFPFTGSVKKVEFDLAPHPKDEHRKAVHQAYHHMAVAHGISELSSPVTMPSWRPSLPAVDRPACGPSTPASLCDAAVLVNTP